MLFSSASEDSHFAKRSSSQVEGKKMYTGNRKRQENMPNHASIFKQIWRSEYYPQALCGTWWKGQSILTLNPRGTPCHKVDFTASSSI